MTNLLRAVLIVAGTAGLRPPLASAADKLLYNRDVRPILVENCFACHGADSAARKAGLRLDQRDAAIDKGAITPGKPIDSELVARIGLPKDQKKAMPPPQAHKELTAAQKAILTRWVAEGAEYQPHWSFIAPTRPAVPAADAKWARNPIDNFVLAELTKRGWTLAPEADRRTLARRLSLDLTGLPPTPADVEAFVKDTAADYYEKFVAKLMASPAWGEHRGRYWLDAARYADTHGIHFDNYREMYSYRDWVIDAFNRNQRFDDFTREQLAGDLLPNATVPQKVATGFNRCNITTNEGGSINEEVLVQYTRDRTETASQVFLGLTTGCAVCHDHKFDPVSQKEFYALAAFFNHSTQNAMDGNIADTPPIIPVARPEDRAAFDKLTAQIDALKKTQATRKTAARPAFAAWAKGVTAADAAKLVPAEKLHFHAKLNEGQGRTFAATVDGKTSPVTLADGFAWTAAKFGGKAYQVQQGGTPTFPTVGDFDTKQGFAVAAWVKITRRGTTGALASRMDAPPTYRGWDFWIEGDKIGMHIVSSWPTDALKVVAKSPLQPNQWKHVVVTYDGSAKPGGVRIYYDGVPQPTDDPQANTLQSSIQTTQPFRIGQRTGGERVQNVGLQDLRVYARPLSGPEAEQLAKSPRAAELLAKKDRTPADDDELFDWWLVTLDKEFVAVGEEVGKLQAASVNLRGKGTIAHIMNEKPGMASAFVLNRGEYDQRRDKVDPGTPAALPPLPKDAPKNRLGLAQWLLRPDHPLTARVTVNRFWQELYGTGLVRTAGDFGITGELPSHPELLDWLAVEFRESGWDVKKFYTLLVTSATYRQSAAGPKDVVAKDPANVYLARGPRFRMDAEMVRDYALAASGLMVGKIGGPSVKPYQPDGVWEAVAMRESNTRTYKRDSGEALYRRSLYTFWKRAAPPAAMDVLNAPNRETCTVRRERTNTPLQALLTLNDVQFVEAARVLAQAAVKSAADDAGRTDFVAQRLLARSFSKEEAAVVAESLAALRAAYKAKPEEAKKLIAYGDAKADATLPAAELAAWAMLCNQLLNLDEVLNK